MTEHTATTDNARFQKERKRVRVRFVRSYQQYNVDDVASFTERTATDLLRRRPGGPFARLDDGRKVSVERPEPSKPQTSRDVYERFNRRAPQLDRQQKDKPREPRQVQK